MSFTCALTWPDSAKQNFWTKNNNYPVAPTMRQRQVGNWGSPDSQLQPGPHRTALKTRLGLGSLVGPTGDTLIAVLCCTLHPCRPFRGHWSAVSRGQDERVKRERVPCLVLI